MAPAGFEIQAAVHVPARRQFQLLADRIAAAAGFILQAGAGPTVGRRG